MLKAGYTAVAEFHYVHHDLDGRSYADPPNFPCASPAPPAPQVSA